MMAMHDLRPQPSDREWIDCDIPYILIACKKYKKHCIYRNNPLYTHLKSFILWFFMVWCDDRIQYSPANGHWFFAIYPRGWPLL